MTYSRERCSLSLSFLDVGVFTKCSCSDHLILGNPAGSHGQYKGSRKRVRPPMCSSAGQDAVTRPRRTSRSRTKPPPTSARQAFCCSMQVEDFHFPWASGTEFGKAFNSLLHLISVCTYIYIYREGLFWAPLFCVLFLWRPFVFAQERKKEATRTWRESRTLSPKRSVGLQWPEPQKKF